MLKTRIETTTTRLWQSDLIFINYSRIEQYKWIIILLANTKTILQAEILIIVKELLGNYHNSLYLFPRKLFLPKILAASDRCDLFYLSLY